jgi:hypothetical protein
MIIKMRSGWLVSVVLTVGLLLGGCTSGDEPDPNQADPPLTVERVDESQPARLTLREDAEKRLGIQTAPVVALPGAHGKSGGLAMPYAAVIYDAEGSSWAYSAPEPRVYVRVPLVIASIKGDTATLSSGPPPGTQVVVVGAPELVGAEAGISGEE